MITIGLGSGYSITCREKSCYFEHFPPLVISCNQPFSTKRLPLAWLIFICLDKKFKPDHTFNNAWNHSKEKSNADKLVLKVQLQRDQGVGQGKMTMQFLPGAFELTLQFSNGKQYNTSWCWLLIVQNV